MKKIISLAIFITFLNSTFIYSQTNTNLDSIKTRINDLEKKKNDLKDEVNEIEIKIEKLNKSLWIAKNKELDPNKFYATIIESQDYITESYDYKRIKKGTKVEVLEYNQTRGAFKFQRLDLPGEFYFSISDKLLKSAEGLDFNNLVDIQSEAQKKNEIEDQNRRTMGKNFFISNIDVMVENYAGGVSFQVEWDFADPNKEIKYLLITVEPYNAVADKQTCEIRGTSIFTGKITGPISGNSKINKSYFENAWYNNTIRCLKVTKVKIDYMDGSHYVYVNEVPKIINANSEGICN